MSPKDVVGLKVNPVAGRLLTTSHAVTKSVIKQLEEAGIPRANIVIWDRREMQLHETGYTSENYPGDKDYRVPNAWMRMGASTTKMANCTARAV